METCASGAGFPLCAMCAGFLPTTCLQREFQNRGQSTSGDLFEGARRMCAGFLPWAGGEGFQPR